MLTLNTIATQHIGKCRRCGTVNAATWTANEANAADYSVICRGCARTWTILTEVTGKPGKRECGPWCIEGTGKSCTCTCNGMNHGAAHVNDGTAWAGH